MAYGLKNEIDNKILITNSSEIKNNFLINNFITEFDENYSVLRNYQSEKIDINNKNGLSTMPKFIKKIIIKQKN